MRYRGRGRHAPRAENSPEFRLMSLTACGRHALIPGVGAISLLSYASACPSCGYARSLLAAISMCNGRVNLHHFVHFLFKSK